MIGTRLRVGELTGLRWCDIDLEEGVIDVNHTLVYYDHRTSEGKKRLLFQCKYQRLKQETGRCLRSALQRKPSRWKRERQEILIYIVKQRLTDTQILSL